MARGRLAVVGITGLLLGLVLGRGFGTQTIRFPEVDETRTAAEMEVEVLEVLAHPLASVRASSLARLFEGLTPENAPGAARAVSSRSGRWDPVDMQVFLASWVRIDPEAAMEEIGRWPTQSRRELGLHIAVREWAASGGWLQAAEYIQTAMDPELEETALGPLVRGWALSGDVRGAMEQARRIHEVGGPPAVVDGLVRGVLHVQGPEGVLSMARRLEAVQTDPFEQRVARVSLELIVREEPAQIVDYFRELSSGGTPDWLAPSIPRLAEIWRNQDPAAALDWLLELDASEAQGEALARSVADWGIRDLEAAQEWVGARIGDSSGPDGRLEPPRSLLVVGLLPKLSRVRPEIAAEWAERLPLGPGRLAMMQRVANVWMRDDPAAASAWLETVDVTPEQREAIRGRLPGSG